MVLSITLYCLYSPMLFWNQSYRYDHSCLQLIILIKTNTINPSQKSMVLDPSVLFMQLLIGLTEDSRTTDFYSVFCTLASPKAPCLLTECKPFTSQTSQNWSKSGVLGRIFCQTKPRLLIFIILRMASFRWLWVYLVNWSNPSHCCINASQA